LTYLLNKTNISAFDAQYLKEIYLKSENYEASKTKYLKTICKQKADSEVMLKKRNSSNEIN